MNIIPTAKEAFDNSTKNRQHIIQERVIAWMKLCEERITQTITCGEYEVKIRFEIFDGFNTIKSNLKKLGYKVSRIRTDKYGNYFTISWKRKRERL